MYPDTVPRQGGRSRRRRLTAVLAAPFLAAPLLTGAASPGAVDTDASGVPTEVVQAAESAGPKTVTLVTGDKVTVQPGGGATVEPGPGREHVTFLQSDGGPERLTVLPADAGRLVADGKLDERLFDVSYLIKEGFDDAHTSSVPLLVDGEPDRVRALAIAAARPGAGADKGSGVRVTRELRQVGMSAVAQDKAHNPGGLWAQLARSSDPAGRSGKGAGPVGLPTGVDKIWLDAFSRVTLDRSVPQVGAPQAWQAGFDGTGVTVAVLDTGVDATHPDLAGQVVREQNFTSEASPADGHGHGTHVSSTIASTGAADGGRYKGVAPGARILNGKVCNSGGQCADSWVLAGMEWAATNGADVVNMSLGGGPTDGTDPMSQAVNTLTAQHGTLFVISAGNSGPNARTVAAPGAADAALTVAAVDRDDQVAGFSSRGPRFGDYAIKPDIAAPGVGIVAARGTGTGLGAPLGEHYTTASGTSMAAPHVAGGAAILAQRHPEWGAAQLKTGLMGASNPAHQQRPFDIGAGRLDVHRAVTQQVHTTTPSVSFGLVRWPHDVPPVTRTISYRNDSTQPVTLNLAATAANETGTPAPNSLFSLDNPTLTVPAGGTADATLTMNPADVDAGAWSGRVTATTPDGTAAVQSVIGAFLEPESYDLTVNLLDRNGNPTDAVGARSWFHVYDYTTGDSLTNQASGTTVRLPARGHFLAGYIRTPRPDKQDNRAGRLDDTADIAYPEFELTKDTVLTLDARDARKIKVTVDEPTAGLYSLQDNMAVKAPAGSPWTYYIFQTTNHAPGNLERDIYAGSVGESSDKFLHLVRAQLTEPLIRLDVNGKHGFAVETRYADNQNEPGTPLLGTHRMGVVHGGTGTPAELAAVGAAGKVVVLDNPPSWLDLRQRISNVADAGGRAVLLDRSPFDGPSLSGEITELPILLAADPQRTRLVELARQGNTSVTTHGVATSPYQYNLLMPTEGHVAADQTYHPRNHELGVVEADYRFTGALRQNTYRDARYAGRGWGTGFFRSSPSAEPEDRTEYYSPGPVQWNRRTRGWNGEGPSLSTRHVAYEPGQRHRITDWQGVMGPSFATIPTLESVAATTLPINCPHFPPWVSRNGDTLGVCVPMFVDQGQGRYSSPGGKSATGYARLYRNDQLIGNGSGPAVGTFTVPSGPGEFRLEVGATPPTTGPAGWQISTNVESAWTFTSTGADGPEVLPLMAVRYKPTLDDYNRAPAGRRINIPVRVEHQPGSVHGPVTALSVQASFDDGATWRPVPLKRSSSGWTATLTNPADGFVTLRAQASDADGNTMTQTITRAYGIAAR